MSQVVFTLQNHVEISMCQAKAVSVCDVCYVVMTPHTIFDVNHNKIEYFIETKCGAPSILRNDRPCYFQYFSTYDHNI